MKGSEAGLGLGTGQNWAPSPGLGCHSFLPYSPSSVPTPSPTTIYSFSPLLLISIPLLSALASQSNLLALGIIISGCVRVCVAS